MATIKAIEARTVHQIQSGQVIVDLCSVVKELVENSIDAGATNIEVRFKNQGLDSIEVQDNGFGISKENYETLALKHYTSKLSTYSDLESLETFGFRGEALSSLCALSKFTVTTCLAVDAPKGSRLEYETSGKLRNASIVASQKGTTVSIEGLFQNLPVRRRELERNIKREWNKVLVVLNQYACIQTGLKFSVSQQPTKGKRMVLFSTKGNQTTRENIVNVFGAKTLNVLLPLDLQLELEPTTTPRSIVRHDDQTKVIRVKGHVSRPAHGEGRQTPDRQMFFVNGRPCGLPQFAKVFNEVYRSYNSSQSPFIFADIQLDTHLYDVNVSPDKRTILLHDQTRMLDNLRESLSALFESQDYALPTSQLQPLKPVKRASSDGRGTPLAENGSAIPAPVDTSSKMPETPVGSQPIPEPKDADVDEPDDSSPVVDAEDDDATNQRRSAKPVPTQAIRENNLMSRWIERKSVSRPNSDTKARTNTTGHLDHENDPKKTVPTIPTHDAQDDRDISAGSSESPADVAIAFRARLEALKQKTENDTANDLVETEDSAIEPPIPALAAPARISNSNSVKSIPPLSTKRMGAEVATITIGDHTTTSIIGSTNKRQRTDKHQHRDISTGKRSKVKTPMPSFNGRLSQMFAAQTTRNQADMGLADMTTEMEGNSDHSDSSSEQLFVEDEDDRLSNSDQELDMPLTKDDEGHASPTASPPDEKMIEGVSEKDSEGNSSSSSDEKDEEYEPDASQVPKDEEDDFDDPPSTQGAPSEEAEKRTQSLLKGNTKKKDSTCLLQQMLKVDEQLIRDLSEIHQEHVSKCSSNLQATLQTDALDADDAEEKLSLTISKSDFGKMKIIGQFNLGFILASRAADRVSQKDGDDELFIIDQHATDEKYNFERLQASTVVQSQRLVQPKTLELTAVEEDIVQENLDALETNGFMVNFDDSGDEPVGTRCQLLSLPLSRETTFSLADLEELISLLQDHQGNTVPRPSKVRKMFAMRACRSSVMIGKSLSAKQMEKLVRHMGELDKPWNCPHGRPTMRHLCGLGAWDDLGWREGDGLDGTKGTRMNWAAYARGDSNLE